MLFEGETDKNSSGKENQYVCHMTSAPSSLQRLPGWYLTGNMRLLYNETRYNE